MEDEQLGTLQLFIFRRGNWMYRELLGHVAGTAVFVLGYTWWFIIKERLNPKLALMQSLQMGMVYLFVYLIMQKVLAQK